MNVIELQKLADQAGFPAPAIVFEKDGLVWLKISFPDGPVLGKRVNPRADHEKMMKYHAEQARQWHKNFQFHGSWEKASPALLENIERGLAAIAAAEGGNVPTSS